MSNSIKRRLFLILFVAFFIVLIGVGSVSYSSVIVPKWQITVLDGDGRPIPDQVVHQFWIHSTFESANSGGHEESLVTDDFGTVSFPERTFSASLIRRGWGFFKERIDFSTHTSYGPFSMVFIEGPNSGSLYYRGGPITDTTITAKAQGASSR
ncbi:MAG: hypothetical protein ABL999_16990 [Pyrinomonadaceae bacterium]